MTEQTNATTAHTPGPWATMNKRREVGTVDYCVAVVTAEGPTDEVADANARLIAAAPELLDALRQLLAHVESWKVVETADGDIARSRAAIAKAEGR